MGAFSKLMLEAKAAGAVSLTFKVNLEGFTGESDRDRWEARAVLDPFYSHTPPHVAAGRSGEEALRELVAFLRKTG